MSLSLICLAIGFPGCRRKGCRNSQGQSPAPSQSRFLGEWDTMHIITRCGRAGEARICGSNFINFFKKQCFRFHGLPLAIQFPPPKTPLTPSGQEWNCRPSVRGPRPGLPPNLLAWERSSIPNSNNPIFPNSKSLSPPTTPFLNPLSLS